MKSTSYNTSREKTNKNILWNSFENYLENNYFEGALEVLDTKLIAFEYENFKSCYA